MEVSSAILCHENDLVPNRYAARFMTWIGALMVPCEILNETGVFLVEKRIMRIAMLIVLACVHVIRRLGLDQNTASKRGTKYIITAIANAMVFAVLMLLDHWTNVAMFLPLFLAAQYHSRPVTVFAIAVTCLTGLLSAPLGCVLGLWSPGFLVYQLNALGYSVQIEKAAEGVRSAESFFRIMMYMGLPRLMLAAIFGIITFSISRSGRVALSERVKETGLSRIDALTNVFSRVNWEAQLELYKTRNPEALTCVYADVNALHTVNNTEGHEAGDKLLIACAGALVDVFGPCVYRTGGDEFVVLTDQDFNIAMRIRKTEEILEKQGYSMSMGGARLENGETVHDMVRRAEKLMYAEKRAYYQKEGNDRRQSE